MTYQDHSILPSGLLDQIAADGCDALRDLIRIILDAAMQVERQRYLGAGPYERSPARRGRANVLGPRRSVRGWEREGGLLPRTLCAEFFSFSPSVWFIVLPAGRRGLPRDTAEA